MPLQLQYIEIVQLIMDNTTAANLSSGVFAIVISVTRTMIIQNALPFYKFREKLTNSDTTEEALKCTASL